jgi:lipase
VFLHGVTSWGGHARRLAEGWLSDRHRVLAPDLIGHGASPYEPPWSLEAHIDAVLDAVGREPAAWIGHSFGGRLAYELAARDPGLVEQLVLLDPAIELAPHVALFAAESSRTDRSYATPEEAVDRRYEESQLSGAPRTLVGEEVVAHLEPAEGGRWRYRYSQAAVIAAFGELARRPAPFTGVRVPTLLVLGKDSYLPYDHLLGAHRAALGDLLTVVAVNGGHTVLWDALEETAIAISSFLAPA